MNEERKRILNMLATSKITAEEAEQLLDALGIDPGRADSVVLTAPPTRKVKYLRVTVDAPQGNNGNAEKVNIRVPIQLLRAGMKFTTLIPKDAQGQIDNALHEKGIQFNLSEMTPEAIDELITSLGELTIDVDDSDGSRVRVFCE